MDYKKVNVKDLTKAQLADFALSHFGATINRKNPKPQVEKEFKQVENDYIEEKKLEEEEKAKDTKIRQENAAKVAEKQQASTKIRYPHEMKDKDGNTIMHRPCAGAICLGDPPTRQVVEGESVTNSAPYLEQD